jgi:hypothetical protein
MEAQSAPPPPPPPPPPLQPAQQPYPLTFSVDYPDRKLSRLSTFFRVFAIIPIAIILNLLTGGSFGGSASSSGDANSYAVGFGGLVVIPTLLMILFRKKYPGWWAEWNRQLLRFSNRVGIYLFLMNDEYPSTDEEQSVHLNFENPNAEQDLMRGMPLVKWFLAIPHYFVLFFLEIAAFFCVLFAWFAILFTGGYPRSLFDFVEGVIRWHNRVVAYALILITDEYPPFRLSA